jgi:hypothetical protein
LRRVGIGLLLAVLAVGLAGGFGVRTASVSASGGGYELTVTHAAVTRPGLATPFDIEVRRAGGLGRPVTVAISSDYLEMFDENGIDPDPASSTSDPGFVHMEFDPPPSGTLTISFDVRLEPGVQWGKTGRVVLLDGERAVADVSFRTWVMP